MGANRRILPPLFGGLSARLLVLTVFFVMLAEFLIFAPSIARYRHVYFQDQVDAARLAALALEATPESLIQPEIEQELLREAGVREVELVTNSGAIHMPGSPGSTAVDASFDLRESRFFALIREAFLTLAQDRNRVLKVTGLSSKDPKTVVTVVFDEVPLRLDMYDYASRILALSIFISLITAGLVYLSLQLLLVRPMRRLTESLVAFRERPEDVSSRIAAGNRSDEIGIAEHELADMQEKLRAALIQKTRLAALGTAVAKISHDLRNLLSPAVLLSDRLVESEDPEVKRIAPRLVHTIDHAVELCTNTLRFAREEHPRPQRTHFPLKGLIEEVGAAVLPESDTEVWDNAILPEIEVHADREQIFRIITNLGRNAYQAGAKRVRVTARRERKWVEIEVADDGPGLPEKACAHLFEPFTGSARAGGTGLGLAIARELMRGHGGDITLARSTHEGTVFRLRLPD
jgi:signal transduction histidine kinase